MQTVKVRLRKPNRVFTFLNRDIPLERNDPCIVRSDRGLEYGVCVLSSEPCGEDAEKRFRMTVVRRATSHDVTTFERIVENEQSAARICTQKIHERKMAMKLAEVEYTFDQRKVIFYFTAEERVDFRELVRDLAREFKVRIELRHIQVRDEAKMIGGIGTCGRELCCTTWLREFTPISMKMAKRQNLSLNPSKISGQCGRLMCCLSYENEHYASEKRKRGPVEHPKELAKIRNEMEDHAEEAARTIETAASPSGGEERRDEPEGGAGKGRFSTRKRSSREPASTPKNNEAASAKPEKQPTGANGSTERPKRRRRRRRRRPAGQRGGQGGGSSSSGPSS